MEIHTSKPLINIKVFILLFFSSSGTYSNPCTLDNGKICEHSCLKSSNTVLCTCPDGHYLHSNRYKCVGKLCCSAIMASTYCLVVSFQWSRLRKERREGKEKLTNKRTTTNQMNKQTDRPSDRQIDLYFDFISQMSMSATCLHVNMTAITLLGHITVLVFLDFLFNRIEKDAKVIKL